VKSLKLPLLILGGALLLVFLLAAWVILPRLLNPPEPEFPRPTEVNVSVQVIASRKKLPDDFTLPAVIEPLRTVTISAEVDGRVEKLHVPEGAACRTGQLILELNTDLLKADADRAASQLRIAEANLVRASKLLEKNLRIGSLQAEVARAGAAAERAKSSWKRADSLFREGGLSREALDTAVSARDQSAAALQAAELALQAAEIGRREELENAEAARDAARAARDAASTRLKRARVLAPVGGVLDDLPVEKGEYVNTGKPVARIVDSSSVKAVAMVPERDVQYLRVNQSALVIADVRGTRKKLPGKITYISELADRTTRATRAEITVANPEGLLRAGRIVSARVTRRVLDEAFFVPLSAVIPLEKTKAVFLVEGEEAVRREVVLSSMIKTFDRVQYVRVLSGLKAGDRLIVNGQRFVGPGQKIKVVPGPDGKPAPSTATVGSYGE
jgi:multidrug efflux pump subunit AcrA (membrane-fusion protein)